MLPLAGLGLGVEWVHPQTLVLARLSLLRKMVPLPPPTQQRNRLAQDVQDQEIQGLAEWPENRFEYIANHSYLLSIGSFPMVPVLSVEIRFLPVLLEGAEIFSVYPTAPTLLPGYIQYSIYLSSCQLCFLPWLSQVIHTLA